MAIDLEEFENMRERYKKIPKIKPIKIYAYDQKLNKKRIVQLDSLLHLINRGEFKDENATFYYRTAYERDIDEMKHFEKGVDVDF